MAGGITDSILEEIKARIDLADLISSYGVQVRHAGANEKACCPFHQEKTPSFMINSARGFYHCFGCGESGDAIAFVMKMEGLTFPEATKKLAQQCGIEIKEKADPEAARRKRLYALMNELAQFYHRCLLRMKEAQPARDYLVRRRLDEKVQTDYVIGYAPNGISPILTWGEKYGYTPEELEAAGVIKGPSRPGDRGYHRFGGRLMFTIKDKQGRVVAFSGRQLVEKKNAGKYVNSPETAIFKKAKVLFGFDRAAGCISRAPHREVICCEGQIDTIRLHISGFPTAVASQGTAFTEDHARMIKRVADAAVLMYDDDAAGHKAAIKVAGMLLAMEMPVRVVSLPNGDDPDSFLLAHPAKDLQDLIDRAESIVSFQCRVERAKEARPDSIDAVSRISRAVLTTLAACPSAILRASLTDEAAKLLGLPTAALAEELSKVREGMAAAGPKFSYASATDEDDAAEGESDDEAVAPWRPGGDSMDEESPAEPPAQLEPPSAREFVLMEFLMANEFDVALDGMIGEFLPPEALSHDFTRRFVSVWRRAASTGEDQFASFAEGLTPGEREWFDRILLNAGMSQASGLSVAEQFQNAARLLWADLLKRMRGALPINGGPDVDARRMEITMDLNILPLADWREVGEIIRRTENLWLEKTP